MSKRSDANFSVEIRGLKLPEDVAKKIETEIRQTVMRELGKIDLTGHQFTYSKLEPRWFGMDCDVTEREVPK